jgi:NAD(P)-dependent dehydrogenase (short-subunit alcohol dehydrogenase family)
MGALEGKYALVTGGASGIGRACVQRFRAEGATVFAADIAPTSSDEITLDVRDSAAWAAVVTELPPLDIVMLNAGITTPGRAPLSGPVPALSDITDEAYRAATGVNLDGVFFGARAVVPGMIERGGGHVLITASVAGLSGMSGDIIYSTTKHAVVGFTRSLGASLEGSGVTASSICPGFMDTPLVSADLQRLLATFNVPVAPPSRVADAAMTALGTPVNGAQWVVWGDEPVRQYEWNPAVTL